MASTSYSGTPSDVRRLRAARLNFEPPSFSLGIDTETVRSTLSLDACTETVRKCGEEKTSKPLVQTFIQTDCEEGIENGLSSGKENQRHFKRLKKGPQTVREEPFQDVCVLSCNSECRSTKYLRGCSEQLQKEPLLSVNDCRNHEPDDVLPPATKSFGIKRDCIKIGNEAGILSSGSDLETGLNRLKRRPLIVSGEIARSSLDTVCMKDVPKSSMQIDGGSGGGMEFNWETPPTKDDVRNHASENIQVSVDGEVDEIEEFSDDELFISGSGTQKDCRSLRPQMTRNDPVLITSSPENFAKHVLHTPGADSQARFPKVPLKLSQPKTAEIPVTDEDAFLIDDFQSGTNWWKQKKPNLGGPGQTPQPNKAASSASQRTDSGKNLFKTSHLESRDINFGTFHTETPLRRDTVGPSRAEVPQTGEYRILAFLRQRFPHYKSVDALLVDGGLDNEPVYIDYRKQFADGKSANSQPYSENTRSGMRWPAVRSISGAFAASPPSASISQRRNLGKKKGAAKSRPKKQKPEKGSSSGSGNARAGKPSTGGPAEGKWRTLNGSRVYIVGAKRLSGRSAYTAYKGRGNSSKNRSKKRAATKSK